MKKYYIMTVFQNYIYKREGKVVYHYQIVNPDDEVYTIVADKYEAITICDRMNRELLKC